MIWRQQTGAPGHLRPAQCKKKKKKRKVTVASTMIASWSPGPLRYRMTPRGLGVGQLQPRAAQTTRERVPVPVAREGTARWLTRPARRRHASGGGGTPHNCPKTHGPITSGVPCIPIRIHYHCAIPWQRTNVSRYSYCSFATFRPCAGPHSGLDRRT